MQTGFSLALLVSAVIFVVFVGLILYEIRPFTNFERGLAALIWSLPMNYVTSSTNPDGVRAEQIKESLVPDIQEELGHAQQFAARIKELYGVVPGSEEFEAEQGYLQPPEEQTDIVSVIRGVIEAETGAIEHYQNIVEETEGVDHVTQDMVIVILRDEQGHRRLFEGYLREYEAEGLV